jgi:hypothetical protein
MNTKSGIKAQVTGEVGVGEEVVTEALRLALSSCEEEERRWIEIGFEAEQALAKESLLAHEREVLLRLTAERDARLEHIAAQCRELRCW